MASASRVLLCGEGGIRRDRLATKLSERGYGVDTVEAIAAALAATERGHPDVIVVSAAGRSAPALDQLRALIAGQPAPVIVIGAVDRTEAELVHGNQPAVVDFLPDDFRDGEFMARVNTLARLNVMREELLRRRATSEKFKIKDNSTVAPPTSVGDAQIALAGHGRDAEEAAHLIGADRVVAKTDLSLAMVDRLVESDFDSLVVAVDGQADAALELCDDVRKNSRLYNLPILMIANKGSFADPDAPFAHGANDVIHRPAGAADFAARLDALVIQQRYRFAMRRVFRTLMRPPALDGLTGLYSHGFAHEHLSALIADAAAGRKPLTVGLFDIKDLGSVNKAHGYAGGDLLIKQVGSLVGALVRGEDLAARVAGDSFVVALPDTRREAAMIALARIAAVIGNTEFAVAEMESPTTVYLQLGVAEIEPGDTAKSMIVRARALKQ